MPSPCNVLFVCLAIDAHIAFQFALHGSCVVESAKCVSAFRGNIDSKSGSHHMHFRGTRNQAPILTGERRKPKARKRKV